MKLGKIYRVIKFQQSKWLAPYIQTNSTLRAQAKNDFEKEFFKLMNNAVYGKTCENLKKRTDIKLVTDRKKAKKLVEKPHCLGFKIFKEELVGISMRKIRVLIDKPFYVGFAVLELSKLLMYQFHYDFIQPMYGLRAELLFTDTDSLMYEIECADAYKDMWQNRDRFDLAGYPNTSEFHDPTNNKVIGKFKDEANGEPIVEFVGLKPKMYSYILLHELPNKGVNPVEKHRSKGICRAAARRLRHKDFLEQLQRPAENYLVNRRIASKLHKLYTYEIKKRGLCAYDDKRFLLEDGVTSLAFGHTRITAQHVDVLPADGQNFIVNSSELGEEERANAEDLAIPDESVAAHPPSRPTTPMAVDITSATPRSRAESPMSARSISPAFRRPQTYTSISTPLRPAATPARAPTPQRAPLYAPAVSRRSASLSTEDALLIIAEAHKQAPNIAFLIPHLSIDSSHILPLISHAKDCFIERATQPRMIQKLKDTYTLILEYHQ